MVVRSGVLRISECGCHLPTRDEIGGDRSAKVRKWVTSPILSPRRMIFPSTQTFCCFEGDFDEQPSLHDMGPAFYSLCPGGN